MKHYLSRFTKWRPCQYRIRSYVNGKLYTFPVNRNTLNEFFNVNLKTEKEAKDFLNSIRIKIKKPKNAEEQILSLVEKKFMKHFLKIIQKNNGGLIQKNWMLL